MSKMQSRTNLTILRNNVCKFITGKKYLQETAEAGERDCHSASVVLPNDKIFVTLWWNLNSFITLLQYAI